MEKLNRALAKGDIPNELNYTATKQNDMIDLEKLRYNTFYKSHDYFDQRFHPCIKKLPGYEKILDTIVEKNKDNSLTKEMADRTNIIFQDKDING